MYINCSTAFDLLNNIFKTCNWCSPVNTSSPSILCLPPPHWLFHPQEHYSPWRKCYRFNYLLRPGKWEAITLPEVEPLQKTCICGGSMRFARNSAFVLPKAIQFAPFLAHWVLLVACICNQTSPIIYCKGCSTDGNIAVDRPCLYMWLILNEVNCAFMLVAAACRGRRPSLVTFHLPLICIRSTSWDPAIQIAW